MSQIHFLSVGGGVGRGGLVRSRLVGSRLVGGGLVGSGLVLIVAGLTLVGHISDVARVGIGDGVGHNLGAAVGKDNTVAAVGGIAVTGLVGIKVNLGVVVLDSVGVLVLGGLLIGRLLVGGRLVRRSRLVGGGLVGGVVSQSHSGEGKNDEGLHFDLVVIG